MENMTRKHITKKLNIFQEFQKIVLLLLQLSQNQKLLISIKKMRLKNINRQKFINIGGFKFRKSNFSILVSFFLLFSINIDYDFKVYKYLLKMGKKTQIKRIKKNALFQKAHTITKFALGKLALKKAKNAQNALLTKPKFSEKNKLTQQNTQKKKEVDFLDEIDDIIDPSVFQCPVCISLIVEPRLLECGHAYCAKCLEQLMIYKSTCCICRHTQISPQFQKYKRLQTLIQKTLLKDPQSYIDYYCRVTDHQNWKKIRNIPLNQVTKGVYIDFRDKELKWRKGEINRIQFISKTNTFMFEINYKLNDQIVTEVLQSDSERYTRFTYYTRMKYLQKDHKQGEEQSVNEADGESFQLLPFMNDNQDQSVSYLAIENTQIRQETVDQQNNFVQNHEHSSFFQEQFFLGLNRENPIAEDDLVLQMLA